MTPVAETVPVAETAPATSASILASNRAYRERNKERIALSKKEWAARNREKINAYKREWRARNPDKVRASRQRYNAKHPDRVKESYAAWMERNREAYRARKKEYDRKRRQKLWTSSRSGGEAALVHIRSALQQNQMYASIWSKLQGYSLETREDIASETLLVMLEHPELTVDQAIPRARSSHYRAIRDWGVVSLDEPITRGGSQHDYYIHSDMERF